MDGPEWPYLVRGNAPPLAPGMCFSDEPGIYITGEFGVRLEDDWHVTEFGGKISTPQSPSLAHPFSTPCAVMLLAGTRSLPRPQSAPDIQPPDRSHIRSTP